MCITQTMMHMTLRVFIRFCASYNKQKRQPIRIAFFFERRGEKTRTSDPLHPMQVR